jgi:lipopolysaccharide transport system permease protein
MLGLYVLVFGFIFNGHFKAHTEESRAAYALTVFLGLALYHFVAEIITIAPTVIVANPNLVKKVVFPVEILPVANVGVAFIHLGITLGLVLIGALLTGSTITVRVLWLPVILLPLGVIGLGLSFALASLGVFFRDLVQVAQFATLALLFASAVFYSPVQIPASAWLIMKFNPMIHVIDEARSVALWNRELNFHHLGYLYLFAAAALFMGVGIFRSLRPNFADVL